MFSNLSKSSFPCYTLLPFISLEYLVPMIRTFKPKNSWWNTTKKKFRIFQKIRTLESTIYIAISFLAKEISDQTCGTKSEKLRMNGKSWIRSEQFRNWIQRKEVSFVGQTIRPPSHLLELRVLRWSIILVMYCKRWRVVLQVVRFLRLNLRRG